MQYQKRGGARCLRWAMTSFLENGNASSQGTNDQTSVSATHTLMGL